MAIINIKFINSIEIKIQNDSLKELIAQIKPKGLNNKKILNKVLSK